MDFNFGWYYITFFNNKWGWLNAIIAIIVFFFSLSFNNNWQGSKFFIRLEEKIDSLFYFKD